MKFGPVPVAEAAGAVLAHSVRVTGAGNKARRLPKGNVLSAADIAETIWNTYQSDANYHVVEIEMRPLQPKK